MLSTNILRPKGPIVVFGASGFMGINLFEQLFRVRQDVFAITHDATKVWRLKLLDVPAEKVSKWRSGTACNVTTGHFFYKLINSMYILQRTSPLNLPATLAHSWAGKPLLVVEEHVSDGLAQQLSVKFLAEGALPSQFISLSAQVYPDGLYGNQAYHPQLSDLDPASLVCQLNEFSG